MTENTYIEMIEQAKAQYLANRRSLMAQVGAARQPYIDAAQKLVDAAKTIEEARTAFKLSPKGTTARWNAHIKWTELATSYEEIGGACHVSFCRVDQRGFHPRTKGYVDSEGCPRDPAKEKLVEFVRDQFEKASTEDELYQLYHLAPDWCPKSYREIYQPANFPDVICERFLSPSNSREKIEELYKKDPLNTSSMKDTYKWRVACNKRIIALGGEPLSQWE